MLPELVSWLITLSVNHLITHT